MYEYQTVDRLSIMLENQRRLQLSMPPLNRDPAKLDGVERIQFFKDMKLALEAELQEMIDEMGWKPWATSQHFNTDAIKGEIIDAWHFLMNLWLATGGDAQEFFDMYNKKRDKNLARQLAGYDGVSTKCPLCHRALDDDAVKCYAPAETHLGYCVVKQEFYDQEAETIE